MTHYDVIKQRLESLPTNMIGTKRLTILNIAEVMGQSVENVTQVVQDLIIENRLRFGNPQIVSRSKTYNREYLQVIKQRKTVKKTNHLYSR